MPSSRPTTSYLDILDNIRLIQRYLEGMDRPAFDADSRTRDAVERCLERLSEAATKLGSQAEDLAPGPRIWEIATGDLPLMAAAVKEAPRRLDEAEDS